MTLSRKLFLYFFGIFFLIISVITFFQYEREKEFRTEQLDQLLSTYNHTIEKYVSTQNWDSNSLDEFISIFPDSMLRVTLIDSVGVVLFDTSVSDESKLENHINRPEIQAARSEKEGKAIRHSTTLGIDFYYMAHYFRNIYVRKPLP